MRTDWVTLGAMPGNEMFCQWIASLTERSCHEAYQEQEKSEAHTAIKARNALLPHDPLEAGSHALLAALAGGDVRARLDRDVRVGDAGGGQLAEGAEQEAVAGCDFASLLQHLLQLLEDGVLQDGVDDEHERGQHAGEEARGPVFAHDFEEGRERVGGALLLRGWGGGFAFFGGQERFGGLFFARGHACVDDPDGVRDQHGGGAGDGARGHGLERAEARFLHRAGEVGTGEFIPW